MSDTEEKQAKKNSWAFLTSLQGLLVGMAALIVAATGFYAAIQTRRPLVQSAEVPNARAHIVSPPGGATVGYPEPVRGTVEGLPGGHALWIWIKATDERRIHPLDTQCTVYGISWTCDDVFLGNRDADRGHAFEITLVDAGPGAIETLQQYGERNKNAPGAYDGIDPQEGARVLDSVTVQRA